MRLKTRGYCLVLQMFISVVISSMVKRQKNYKDVIKMQYRCHFLFGKIYAKKDADTAG
jgi:hypothetical protein